jgi:hypothetical protein
MGKIIITQHRNALQTGQDRTRQDGHTSDGPRPTLARRSSSTAATLRPRPWSGRCATTRRRRCSLPTQLLLLPNPGADPGGALAAAGARARAAAAEGARTG